MPAAHRREVPGCAGGTAESHDPGLDRPDLQRACAAAIDLAMHVVAERRLGLPQDARSAFDLLHGDGIIDADLARRLKAMVGFRNIAIHDDQQVHMGTLGHILNERLGDVRDHIARVLDG